MRTMEQAQKTAERRNKKRAKRYPLLALAGVLEQTTAEQIISADERWERAFEEQKQKTWRKAEHYRFLMLGAVEPKVLARCDEEWAGRTLGKGAEFYADFWWHKLLVHAPQLAWAACLDRERHETMTKDVCPVCKKPLRAKGG